MQEHQVQRRRGAYALLSALRTYGGSIKNGPGLAQKGPVRCHRHESVDVARVGRSMNEMRSHFGFMLIASSMDHYLAYHGHGACHKCGKLFQ